MKIQFLIGALVLSMVLIMGCTGPPPIVGGDTDEHGCKASAGYSWCEAKQKCIRNWEEECAACGECPQLSPPSPDFCKDGTIVAGEKNECGCQGPPKCIMACTEEAKVCPDGSAVARNGSNNCEFDPCPQEVGMPNPASKFCQDQGGESNIIMNDDGSQKGICILPYGIECDEWEYFRGECPASITCTAEQKAAEMCTMEYMPVCGDDGITYGNKCAACASKAIDTYTLGECPEKVTCTSEQKAAEICTLEYMPVCGDDGVTYGNKCSACASKNIDYYTPGECPEDNGKLKANECTDPRPEACTKEYMPICGWFDSSIQCIRYPCAATYGNKCSACADPKVAYWTDGECPETIDGSEGNTEENPDGTGGSSPGSAELANPASAYCVERGGTLEIVDDLENEGQIGLCILPNGIECEEWAYMRGECP